MTIETRTSNIEQWVQSVQIPHTSGILKRAPYHGRWKKTAMKIEFLIKTIKDNRELLSSRWIRNETFLHEHLLGAIHKAIGIYSVYQKGRTIAAKRTPELLWNKLGHDQHFDNVLWWDFMGDSSILDEGGYVVVMLSDEGVEYMNKLYGDIRSLVPHCSYTPPVLVSP